jgi:DNA-binding NarL/FixJ family response regulator
VNEPARSAASSKSTRRPDRAQRSDLQSRLFPAWILSRPFLHKYAATKWPVPLYAGTVQRIRSLNNEKERFIFNSMENKQTSASAGTPIRVAIIEDQRDIRECLTFLINGTEGFSCSGSYRSMEEALDRIGHALPDVVLADIGLPGMNGIDGVKILKERYPDLLILMSTVYDDDERVFDAICAGACGYLLKKTPPAKLLENIREAVAGGAPMTPEVARRVITLFREVRPPERANYELTPHEVRLLKLFVEGHNYKTAATEIGVSVNTINFHVRNIYDKLQVHSRSEAVAKALLNRLV